MITIKHDGRFIIPEGEAFIGYTGDNLNTTKEFFVEEVTDNTLIYRMYLLFDDGTSNFFLISSEVAEGGTRLEWNVTSEQIYKSGIVKMQIKASNNDGLIFHSAMTSLLVQRSIEFAECYGEKVNDEFLQHEQALNALANRCEALNDEAESTLDAIRHEKPFTTSDYSDGSITRAKLDFVLGTAFDEFSTTDYLTLVDLGSVSADNAFNNPTYTSEGAKYVFICENPLAAVLQLPAGIPCELTCTGNYQIIKPATLIEPRARKITSIAPTFIAGDWTIVRPHIRTECQSKFYTLESTIGTLNTQLENTLNGV